MLPVDPWREEDTRPHAGSAALMRDSKPGIPHLFGRFSPRRRAVGGDPPAAPRSATHARRHQGRKQLTVGTAGSSMRVGMRCRSIIG